MAAIPPDDAPLNGDYFSGYEVDAVVFFGDTTRIYRARRRSNSTKVILKTLRDESAAREAAVLLQHEFELAKRVKTPSVVQMYALKRHHNLPVIELEDFGGDSLDNISRLRRLTIEEVLQIAVQVAKGLADIHKANIIHKDINPSNIIYNAATGVAKIIDFGISTHLTREQAALTSPEVFEGSLPYISPEQTGRMNRSIDYRTDFYSFGVTLYELLTGRPLFMVSEPIEWFHCHIAKQPVPPQEIDSNIPRPLSEIVLKLISKTAEDRYQSSRGIQVDLKHCLDELRSTGKIAPFLLARQDISDRFQIPQRLYGREAQVNRLMVNFEHVSRGGSRMVLVSGYSGIGKTCLVKEINKPITELRGHFVSGKFEQLNRNTPYSALTAALRDLVRQLLTEPEAKLTEWRAKILEAVGENGQLLTDIIRELELILGPQPKVSEVPPIEAEQRFNRVFQRFIQVFCKPEYPLVIFLDDLQWADSTSLQLLELLTHPESGTTHLLFIGAYRDNEIEDAHPIAIWLKQLRKGDTPLDEIQLRPLTHENLSALLADTLGSDRERVALLADIVARKTAGNPFFAEEFLKSLHKEKLITFSRAEGCWTWDIERIHTQQITDNVADLMMAKLRQLAPETRKLIELGACIGFRFPLSILSLVSEESQSVVAQRLHEGIQAGLIAPIGDAYQLLEMEQTAEATELTIELAFAHDRIHRAAYFLLEKDSRRKAHLKIGRLLQNRLPPAAQKEKIFEITNNLNLGSELINDPKERKMLCRLNLAAGKRAKNANAYRPAFDYLQLALTILDAKAWADDYHLALELHLEAAESAYLSGEYEAMDNLLTIGFSRTNSILDKVKFYLVQISACMARGRLREAIDISKPVMAQLGHHYPATPNKLNLLIKLLQLKRHLRGKSMDDLRKLPKMTDPRHLAAEEIGHRIGGAAMFAQPLLLPLMVFSSVKNSIKNGICHVSLTSFATFGMILAETLGKADQGIAFGQLALELMENQEINAKKGRILHIYNALVRHWKEPIHNSLAPLHKAFCLCLESGDFEYAAHAAAVWSIYAFESGMDLKHLFEELKEYDATMKPLKQGPRVYYLKNVMQKVDNLMGNADDPSVLKGRHYDIDETMPLHRQSGDKSLISLDYYSQMLLSYYFRDYQSALTLTKILREKALGGSQGMYRGIPHATLDALVKLANCPAAGKSDRRRLMRQVNHSLAKIKRWARMNPANCLNKQRLVEAERLRVMGRDFKAHELYDEAIRLARKQGFVHEEALASELCGNMHAAADRLTIGEPYLIRARDLYKHWGASAKVKDLEKRFPQLVQKVQDRKKNTASWGTSHAGVDTGSLIKALKAIAEETIHSRMTEKIIATALEFAGAQQGTLILRNPKGEFCIEAETSADGQDLSILQSTPVTDGNLPQTVINFVTRTRSGIVIQDAQQPNDQITGLNQDPYIQQQGVRSLLCLPILAGTRQYSDMIGMLYLENNWASHAFTQERFDTLEIICLSAAGCLELSRKAVVDGLTELYNHDYFQNILSQQFATARRHGHDLSLILIDIDHFKRFNDTWGYQIGDQVLKEVAEVIKASCRNSDTVARYGGEEMVVILPVTQKEKAEVVGQRIRNSVEKHRVIHNGKQLQVTISLGLAFLDTTTANKDVLIRRAHTALHHSKANGRNRLTIA